MRTFSFAINYNGRNIIASGTIEPIEPEVKYYRNGDVGHPASGGEIYLDKVTENDIDITNSLSEDDYDNITESIEEYIKSAKESNM